MEDLKLGRRVCIMADSINRLNLYFSTPEKNRETTESQNQKEEIVLANNSEEILGERDGPEGFEVIDRHVYYKKEIHHNPGFGSVQLNHYFPYRVDSILELSSNRMDQSIHPADILFLDTETTGLSRTSGTIPFLTGFAYLEGLSIVVEQYFLSDPAGEKNYLESILQKLKSFSYIATYNGKSFDIPLLRSRSILQKTERLKHGLHFDLLHIFKKLYHGNPFLSYAQPVMECSLLGHCREEDVTGSQVPQIYFDSIKYGILEPLNGVVEHNRLDMLGLVFLTLEAIRTYQNRDTSKMTRRSGLARILFRARNDRDHIKILKEKYDHRLEKSDAEYKDLLLLSYFYQKEKDTLQAKEISLYLWEKYSCTESAITAMKIMEHREKDYARAIALGELVQKMLNYEFTESIGQAESDTLWKRLNHRMNRLKEKEKNIERQAIC